MINEESTRNRIRILLDEIQNKADPVMLNRYRSIFRQEVSFFRRSYLAAYLLSLAEDSSPADSNPNMEKSAGNSFRSGSRTRSDGRSKRISGNDSSNGSLPDRKKKGFFRDKQTSGTSPDESKTETQRVLSDEESAQLFISIGRNRKVFPREILALIIARAKLARDDIGTIRVLDNYSFVQVRNTVSDTVIEALNGSKFRGRTLTLNYARNRKEEDQDGIPSPEKNNAE